MRPFPADSASEHAHIDALESILMAACYAGTDVHEESFMKGYRMGLTEALLAIAKDRPYYIPAWLKRLREQ